MARRLGSAAARSATMAMQPVQAGPVYCSLQPRDLVLDRIARLALHEAHAGHVDDGQDELRPTG